MKTVSKNVREQLEHALFEAEWFNRVITGTADYCERQLARPPECDSDFAVHDELRVIRNMLICEPDYAPRFSQPMWIPVTEKMPKKWQTVLVAGGTARWDGKQWYSGMEEPLFGREIQWKVTHWMPFPEAPAAAAVHAGGGVGAN